MIRSSCGATRRAGADLEGVVVRLDVMPKE